MTTDNVTDVDVDALAETVQNLLHCPVKGCPRMFETKRGLSNHLPLHKRGDQGTKHSSNAPGYRPPKTIRRDDGTFECEACGEIHDNEKSIQSHKKKHAAEARENYIRSLEVAAAEVGTLRRALREEQQRHNGEAVETPAPATVPEAVLTVDTALDFVRDQMYGADQEIINLSARIKELEEGSGAAPVARAAKAEPSGDMVATMELIRDSFLRFYTGDLTMTRFVTEVEDALRLMYPDITEE